MTWDFYGRMVDFQDEWAGRDYQGEPAWPDEGDTTLVVLVRGAELDGECYPAVRVRLTGKRSPDKLWQMRGSAEPGDELRHEDAEEPQAKRGRGRPPGAKNKHPRSARREEAEGDAEPQADEPMPEDHRSEFGDRPSMVTKTQWTAITKLHQKLAHPAATTFMRMLRRAGARKEVIASIHFLACRVCGELARPHASRVAAAPGDEEDREFNSDVYMDDMEVVLSDGTKIMCKAMIDGRTSLGVMIAMDATRNA